MGALATFTFWSSEDDLLLKNAVEAGASLESLAKGAVQFSRRYSIREIQDRWHSILYDPIVSEEAAAGMANFELSTSPLPSKFYKFGQSKERKIVSVKRKAESVRTCYYAMRKRVCNNTLTPMDLGFLVDPENDSYLMNEIEPLSVNCMPENCMPEDATLNHFENLDLVRYDFPENTMDDGIAINGVTSCTFYNGVDQTNVVNEKPKILRDNGSLNGAVEALAVDSLIGDDNLEAMPLSTFDDINPDHGNLCSQFDGNCVFDSHVLECGTSLDTMNLSPLSEIPRWATDKSFQKPDMPSDDFGDSITCGDDILAEISNSLLNFTNEEELYLMDGNGKDGIDNIYFDGLTSLLFNPPNDVPGQIAIKAEKESSGASHPHASNLSVSPDPIPIKAEKESLGASRPHVSNLSVSCHPKADDKAVPQSSDGQVAHKLHPHMPSSAPVRDPRFPELINGAICCSLSMEDPEVPPNDDVFLPFDVPPSTFPSASKWTPKESNKPSSSSVMDCGFSNHRASGRGKVLKQVEQKNSREYQASSLNMGSPPLPISIGISDVKCELPNSHISHTVARNAVTVSGSASVSNSVNTTREKSVPGSNDFRNHPQPNGSSIKQELAGALPIQDHQFQHTEMRSSNAIESEWLANPPTLDVEEQYFESDDDVPYFSDIEAMILDMDLDPDDQDLYYNEEVSRYQHEETKRTITRLEQGAHSHMQRVIASHGAFAILYGRRSKHYIKKAEVVIGRATESVTVDIDLGKEGYANKISRRQAVIKMDADGFFYIKNFGKGSILVNSKEVHNGQSQRLHSNCLIELRGLPFIFETNQSRVKEYLNHHHHNTDNS